MSRFVFAACVVLAVSHGALARGERAGRAREREAREPRDGAREGARDRDEVRQRRDDRTEHASPGVNKRQRRQAGRIAGGVRSGQLTEAEVQSLTSAEASFRAIEAAAKSDGVLSQAEREQPHHELTALSRQIFIDKHDADRTAPAVVVRDDATTTQAAADARRLTEVRRALNAPTTTPAERLALEAEHRALIDGLYELATDPE
jgi:hypothetical protein